MESHRGSASVEAAMLLPLVAVVAMLVVQVGLIAGGSLTVWHAAREGARAAAVHDDDAAARAAALAAGLDPDRAEISIVPADRSVGEPVTVTIRYRLPVVVPFVERIVRDDVTIEASVTMRSEREDP